MTRVWAATGAGFITTRTALEITTTTKRRSSRRKMMMCSDMKERSDLDCEVSNRLLLLTRNGLHHRRETKTERDRHHCPDFQKHSSLRVPTQHLLTAASYANRMAYCFLLGCSTFYSQRVGAEPASQLELQQSKAEANGSESQLPGVTWLVASRRASAASAPGRLLKLSPLSSSTSPPKTMPRALAVSM